MEGRVKFYNAMKRFGFIEGEDGNEYFVHQSALQRGVFLRENDKVSFESAETEKGKQAKNVTLLEKGSEKGKQEYNKEEEEQEEYDQEE
ncbi:cold shock domain-containing protein [Candidatus Woesearchaeota archaeon]|nr:cold shock domain-containing protein [Candidatus Woesearchaeota archaeon]